MPNVLNAPRGWYEPLFSPARMAAAALLFDSIDEAAAAPGRALQGVTLP